MNFIRIRESDRQPDRHDPLDSVTIADYKAVILEAMRRAYIDLDLSARDVCYMFSMPYQGQTSQKFFYDHFGAKGQSHGGPRNGKSKSKR